jgi:hypothetical protein
MLGCEDDGLVQSIFCRSSDHRCHCAGDFGRYHVEIVERHIPLETKEARVFTT